MFLSLFVGLSWATLPLKSTHYDVVVSGPYADIQIEQVFSNETDTWMEATYVFPLDADAAVDAMSIEVGRIRLDGIIEERQAAQERYDAAVAEGRAAALTSQERDNVFTQRVGNIPPGGTIVVNLHVVQPVDRDEDGWTMALPLVTGPRFVPDSVEDADAIVPPVSPSDTGHRVSAHFEIDLGDELAYLESPTHSGDLAVSNGFAQFDDLRATRDLVLRWSTDNDEPRATAMRQGEHMVVLFDGPTAPIASQVVPRELVFVIDTSGSQNGEPLEMAKAAMHQALDGLGASDRFTLVQFADEMTVWEQRPVDATPENLARARGYIDRLEANGGTQMADAVMGALSIPHDPARERYVAFLTDGFIGNEREVFAHVEDLRGTASVFTFGLGSSVNRYLIEEMARLGEGAATVVTLDESPEDAVDRFLDTISRPVLSDVEIDWGSYDVVDAPAYLPDLFAGTPLDVVAKVGSGSGPITVRGRLADRPFEQKLMVTDVNRDDAHAIGTMWARGRIDTLERELHWGTVPEVEAEIIDLSIDYSVLSRFTSFVAVASEVSRPEDAALDRVDQAVETPDGVDFETSVSRPYTPPGDPLLTVEAPEDAQVVVVYPWGEHAVLAWDDLRERWYHRFLVPRDVEDGPIDVAIFVLHADGTFEQRTEVVHVDGAAPELDGEVHVLSGRTRVVVLAEEPLRSIEVYPVGRPDLSVRRQLGLFDDAWEHALELPGEWEAVEVVAKDRAMNTVIVEIR